MKYLMFNVDLFYKQIKLINKSIKKQKAINLFEYSNNFLIDNN